VSPVDRLARLLTVLLLGAGTVWLLRELSSVLAPLVTAVLLAYLLDPVVQAVDSKLHRRALSVFGVVLGAGLLTFLFVAAVVPSLANEAAHGADLARALVQGDSPLRQRLGAALPAGLHDATRQLLSDPELHRWITENTEVRGALIAAAKKLAPQMWGMVSGALALLGLASTGLLVLVYLVFLLLDFRAFRASWPTYVPTAYRAAAVLLVADFNRSLARYFRGQFLIASIVGILFCIGFSVIGLRMGLLLGLLIGAMNMVPYLQIAAIPPALLAATLTALDSGRSVWGMWLATLVVFVVVQVVQDVVVTPRVMGHATGLPPVVILFCVFFWGQLLGFVGVLLAIPLTCLGLAYYQKLDLGARLAHDAPET
jgi:predicted PurR-regulated permease PerM